jgi:hypothetical protein
LNHEIRGAANLPAPAWNLVLLGVHSVALTVSFALFNQTGPTGYKTFLKRFVDSADGTNFSEIASELHAWRNVVAHQWLSKRGHELAFDTSISTGWERHGEILHFNPRTYSDAFLAAFDMGGRIWDWQQMLSDDEQEAAKERMIKKYVES